jgi:hypothetical protein
MILFLNGYILSQNTDIIGKIMAVKDCVFSKTNVIITFSAKLPFV